ncbi:MAG: ATPase, T2SS/T4P/T4SS family [Collinsella sp.]|nr:ATPase, T2SS/T4P/T4SS family [Collinsella sp.]
MLNKHLYSIERKLVAAARDELTAATLTGDDLALERSRIRGWCLNVIDQGYGGLRTDDIDSIVSAALDDLFDMGPLSALLDDGTVTEIMVNAPDEIYVERDGVMERVLASFADDAHVRSIIDRICEGTHTRCDDASPIASCLLIRPGSPADRARVQVVLKPISVDHHTINIRLFRRDTVDPVALRDCGTYDQKMIEFLEALTLGRMNCVIAGGTGTGKTTLLGAMSTFIPPSQRTILLEDVPEIKLTGHHIRKQTRAANTEGKGEVTMYDLVRSSLRERPDRIIVGECRGAEAFEMLQAMNTGHEGSFTTVHATSPRDTIIRLRSMVQMSGVSLSAEDIVDMICRAIDFVLFLRRFPDGSRRLVEISEISGLEGSTPILTPLMKFEQNPWDGVSVSGRFVSTGNRPSPAHVERFDQQGVELDQWWWSR